MPPKNYIGLIFKLVKEHEKEDIQKMIEDAINMVEEMEK